MRIASGARRLHPRRSRTCCARPWARRTPRSWPSSARSSSRARRAKGITEKKATQDLRADGALRRLRLQQVALDRLRLPGLPDRLPQGELPRGISRRRCSRSRRRTPTSSRSYLAECRDRGIAGAAARRQREPAALHGGARRGALRAHGHQGRRRGRHRVASSTCARASAASRSLHELSEDLDLRIANKRVFEALVKSGAFDGLGRSPARRPCRRQ